MSQSLRKSGRFLPIENPVPITIGTGSQSLRKSGRFLLKVWNKGVTEEWVGSQSLRKSGRFLQKQCKKLEKWMS